MIAALTFTLRNWKLILGGLALAGLSIALLLAKADARHWEKVANNTQAAFDKTVADYRLASEKAQRIAEANAKRVLTEQQAITQETSSAYQVQLADVRARADALRVQLAKAAANPRGAGTGGASALPATAGGPDAAAAQDGLPAQDWSLEDRVIATEQALQLAALQRWVREQAAVDFQGHP